ncbi:hypothetical protein Btru_014329 [Bulinus truncatus]|nr:hypothetical protein Btru_014329 [Bulinus truncatus]
MIQITAKIIFAVLTLVVKTHCYPDGMNVDTACSSMTPNHGYPPQSSPAPYDVILTPKSYVPGSPVTVTISSNNATFMGFMIQVRRIDPLMDQTEPLGNFVVVDGTRAACSAKALVHYSNQARTSLTTMWNPPSNSSGDVVFRVSIVSKHYMFWTDVQSETVYDASKMRRPARVGMPMYMASPMTTVPSNITKDNSCGQAMGCFSSCSAGTCHYLVSWHIMNDCVVYTLKSSYPAPGFYMALGFSNDHEMRAGTFSNYAQQIITVLYTEGTMSCTSLTCLFSHGRYDYINGGKRNPTPREQNKLSGLIEPIHMGRHPDIWGATQTYGAPRRYMGHQADIWGTTQTYGAPRRHMGHQADIWGTKQTYGAPRRYMVHHADIWGTKQTYGAPRRHMGRHGDDSVLGCAINYGTVDKFTAMNEGHGSPAQFNDTVSWSNDTVSWSNDTEVVLHNASFSGGVLSCVIARPIAGKGQRFDLNKNWTLFFAKGVANSISGKIHLYFHEEDYYMSSVMVSAYTTADLSAMLMGENMKEETGKTGKSSRVVRKVLCGRNAPQSAASCPYAPPGHLHTSFVDQGGYLAIPFLSKISPQNDSSNQKITADSYCSDDSKQTKKDNIIYV